MSGETPGDACILEATGLSRSFDGVRAVHEVSLSFAKGKFTGLIGPNGAGKSTVLAMLAGTLEASAGQIVFGTTNVTHLAVHERARMGLLRTFQHTSEFPSMTVMENLLVAAKGMIGDSLWGALFDAPRWRKSEDAAIEKARGLLAGFNLLADADTPAGRLSGGQRRMVEVMRALMASPEVLLLDEPMAGVQPSLAEALGDYLLGLRDAGMTIVMVEHELSIVERLCDEVFVMADGEVIAKGTMDALRMSPEVVEAYLVG